MTIVALAALAIAVLVVALWLVSAMRRKQFSAVDLRAKDGASFQLPASPPPAEPVILGDIAPIDAEVLLLSTPPAQAPAVDLRLLGLPDDRDDVDREIWRSIHEHLSRRAQRNTTGAATKGKP